MPSRNILRQDKPHSYYHVYSRGISKGKVFLDNADKDYFLFLISRHLSLRTVTSKQGYTYNHYRNQLELLAYCLMDNHFHILLYQNNSGALPLFMKSILVAYTAYFNRKYQRTGPVFEGRYKASLISKDSYLLHVSRYIHLNPRGWKTFPYSSLVHIRNATEPEWLQTARILSEHTTREAYIDFVADYEEYKQMLDELKAELANL